MHFYVYSVYCVVDDFEFEYFHQQYKIQAKLETRASQNFNMNMNHLEIDQVEEDDVMHDVTKDDKSDHTSKHSAT